MEFIFPNLDTMDLKSILSLFEIANSEKRGQISRSRVKCC